MALVFALHHYKPTPLYVMDEIDAALGKSFLQRSSSSLFLDLSLHPLVYIHLNNSRGVPDFKNVSIVGHYVKDRTKDAQFIIIRQGWMP